MVVVMDEWKERKKDGRYGQHSDGGIHSCKSGWSSLSSRSAAMEIDGWPGRVGVETAVDWKEC